MPPDLRTAMMPVNFLKNMSKKYPKHLAGTRSSQAGFTVVELLVAIVIGLLIAAAALGSLFLTRSTAGIAGETARLQQQASYALRIIGAQIRQSGSYEPIQAQNAVSGSNKAITFGDYTDPVVDASSTSTSMLIRTQAPTASLLRRDCLGQSVDPDEAEITALFNFDNGSVRCGPSSTNVQPLTGNIRDFQINYRNYSVNAAGTYHFGISTTPATSSVNSSIKTGVAAIEVCLEMEGTERVPAQEDADGEALQYINCAGESTDMRDRMHRVFRNTYNLRVLGV